MARSSASPLSTSRPLAVVTGASSGIGAALTAALVERDLDAGAPFCWLTHAETRAWVQARHRTAEHGSSPFSDFARTAARPPAEAV